MLRQVAPVADPVHIVDVALVLRALVHLAEIGHTQNLIFRWERPILVEDIIQTADVTMTPRALKISVEKLDALPEAPVCHVQQQNAAAPSDLHGEGRGLLLFY